MNTSLMRMSARKALQEGRISPKRYSQILERVEREEKKSVTFDEKTVSRAMKNLAKATAH